VSAPLWTPSAERIAAANITAFSRSVEQQWGYTAADYQSLHNFSLTRPDAFWRSVWTFAKVRGTMGEPVVEEFDRMPGARFFPEARLNFADNLLRRSDDQPAILFKGEHGTERSISARELRDAVGRFAAALRGSGVVAGDRVAAFIPNIPEAIIAALGAASVGAVWSSCSPDFGVQGVLDRFGQIEPKVLVTADGHFYAGRTHDSLGRIRQVLDSIPSVTRTVVVPFVAESPRLDGIRGGVLWDEFSAGGSGEPRFEQLPFNHPLYILYSSGTTGVPKCIVHGAGGTLIQHLKEHQLHSDIKAGDRVFYFTTCGWMMWNWLVSALASEATLVLYDGSPFHPAGHVLFDLADSAGVTLFGTSAKFIDAAQKAGLEPARTHRLATVRTIASTGSPLAPASFDFVYERVKRDVHLTSISGGTDIAGCFALGNPAAPVWRGEIQARGLGMAVEIFDDSGRPVHGEKGELVCTKPFPSMPIGFWNDPEGVKYHEAYFNVYPGVWRHGDYAEITGHDGVIIYGRSDATLNPGGVRIGTAEIYRQVEQIDGVVESLVVGQRVGHDERIVLFVRLRDGLTLDEPLREIIKRRVRDTTTPRHVPARIVQVPEIPRTKSGKIVELAVREVIHGREVKNREALANPEALEFFREREELQD
jgi:acetoacetyl-CoA synthetase